MAGWSAYPRVLDFERFRSIADAVGAYLVVDMAHFAGLVAAGLHPVPVPFADVVTTTIHKTLGGARGGMILCKEEFARKINSAVFPASRAGPRARDRWEGGRIADRGVGAVSRAPGADTRRGAGGCRLATACGRRRQRVDRRNRRASGACDLRESALDGKQAEDRLAPSGSRSTATRCHSTRGRRRSRAVCGSARRRWRRAASRSRISSRWDGSSPRRFSPTGSRSVAERWRSGPPRSPSVIRCTRGWGRPRRFRGFGGVRGGCGRGGRGRFFGAVRGRARGRSRRGGITTSQSFVCQVGDRS